MKSLPGDEACCLVGGRQETIKVMAVTVVGMKMIKQGDTTEYWRVVRENFHLYNGTTIKMRIEWKDQCERTITLVSLLTSLFHLFTKSLHKAQQRASHHGLPSG